MKANARLETQIIKALAQSMTVDLMEKLAQQVIGGYDLHQRSGFPSNIPLPQQDAARQITKDMVREGLLPRFIEAMIKVNREGLTGRPISIRFLPSVVDAIIDQGFSFNEEYGIFVEGEQRHKTSGWGIMREGSIYELTFLRLDIVGSSAMVRQHPKQTIADVYSVLKRIVTGVVERRTGRIWSWEGDGGLAAFYFGNKNHQAILSGMEILFELFLYNRLSCPLKKILSVRMSVHAGPCHFVENMDELQSDTLRRLNLIESKYTKPDSLTISPGVFTDLGTKLERFFVPMKISSNNYLYTYCLGWE